MDKIIVYTCITGGKNDLLEYDKEDGVKYICFSDDEIKTKTDQWEIMDLEWSFEDPRRTARYHKIMSQDVLPEHDYSVWFDGSMLPKVSIRDLVNWVKNKNVDYCARPHPGWNCIYTESMRIRELNGQYFKLSDDEVQKIDDVHNRYVEEKFPRNYGLHETGVLVRKNCNEVHNYNKMWWKEVKENSVRDQLSFDYIRWKTKKEITDIARVWFEQVQHKHMV
tara:strand:+ start:111 stop:776 length:666 start_codon:yes stop_codon:yes gene_type:complete